MSVFEGIWAIGLFLLYLFGLWILKQVPTNQIVVLFLFYGLYVAVSSFSFINSKTNLSSQGTEFIVQFSDEMKMDGNSFRAVVIDIKTKEKLILTYKIPSQIEKKSLQQRSLLKNICPLTGNLVTPNSSRNQNSFNYKEFLKQEQINWQLNVMKWEIGSCKQGRLSLIDKISFFRTKGISQIEKNFSSETAPLAAALIFGTRDLLTDETLSAYQKLGVIHLISISGLHVALLVGLIFYLGIRFGMTREKVSKSLIMMLPVYAVLTGASPSVNRAVIMTMILLIVTNNKFSFKLRALDGLCISFLLLSLFNPLIVYNIGFQLSYVVTFSLLLSLPILVRYQSNISKMAITSYISQLAALPFLLFHFYEIPLFSIIANLLFIPLYSFIFLPGLIFLFLIQFISNDLFQLLSLILSNLIAASDYIAHLITSISWTRAIPGKPSVLFLLIYASSILLAFYSWEKNCKFKLSFILPWLVLTAQLLIPTISSEGEVTMIDVGQGDSIFIKLPYDQGNYMIDTGGTVSFPVPEWKRKKKKYDVGQNVLIPFLKAKGVQSLDLLILTHGDMDHIGGTLSLLKEIKVKRIVLPSLATERSSLEKEIIKIAEKQKILVSFVSEGESWNVNKNKFYFLAPSPEFSGEKNDGSIVLFAKIGGLKWLFTGDLGKEGEKQLMDKYPGISFDVLKVGHHGSRNSSSSEFIQRFHPKYSIISVGEKNSFGHPHLEVVKILEAGGSKILRTDLHGGITYSFKGENGTFYQSIP